MPFVSRKPSVEASNKLAAFIQQSLEDRKVSLRSAARQMQVSPAILSLIINGERIPDAGVCNAIADFLGVPRVQVYGLAGWLDIGEQDDETLTNLLIALTDSPEKLSQLKRIYYSIGDKTARGEFLTWVQESQSQTEIKTQKSSDSNE